MNNPEFFTKNALDAEGRIFLSDRLLSIPEAEKMGVASSEGYIFFAFVFNGQVIRTKQRSIADKKKCFFNLLPEEEMERFPLPFWNQRNFAAHDVLIITEGEFDAIAIAQLGFENVISLPNGAGSVRKTFEKQYKYLQQFETIYICFDMDESGHKAALEARSLIHPAKYRRVHLPAKDANEWLQEENPDREDFEILMRNAERITSPHIVAFQDLDKSYFDAIDLGAKSGWKEFDDCLGGFRMGEVTVVTGDTGVGKTTFCLHLLYQMNMQRHPAWINSYEMDPKVIMRKIASCVLNKSMKYNAFSQEDQDKYTAWANQKGCHLNPSPCPADLKTLRDQIECASLAHGVQFILLDHLDYLRPVRVQEVHHLNIDEVMRSLHALAMEFQVHIFLVVHPKQSVTSSQKIQLNDLKGSSSIKQYADNIIALRRLDRNEDPDSDEVEFSILKNRMLGMEDTFKLLYNPETDGYLAQ